MSLTKERLERYHRKMNLIVDKLESIPKKVDNTIKIDATLYRVQVSIDATLDLVSMIVRDIGSTVGDDYENIDILVEKELVKNEKGEYLKKLNDLRNAIVHKYNKFEEQTVLENIEIIQEQLIDLVEDVENVVAKFESNKKGS